MKRSLFIFFAFSVALLAEPVIIKDSKHQLMWEHTPQSGDIKRNYDQAQRYCASLTLGGFKDWRVPSLFELLTIVDFKRYKPAIKKPFVFVKKEGSYWSQTPYVREPDERWVVSFKDGATSSASENYDRYVRCVRTLK